MKHVVAALAVLVALVETAAADPPRPAPPHPSGSAGDDLPHKTKDMRVRLAKAQTCLPRGVKFVEGEMPPDDAVFVILESRGDELSICAQAETRRDASVFMDPVSYACWNIDPKTGFLTRRNDIVRGWFSCADGTCTPDTREWPSYEGSRILRIEDEAKNVEILDRSTHKLVGSFVRPADFGNGYVTGEVALIGSSVVSVDVDGKKVLVYDLTGKRVASAPATQFHVASPDVVITGDERLHLHRLDLTRRAVTKIDPPAAAKDYWWSALEYRGTTYALDQASRQLLVLDPKTYTVTSKKQLAICP